ncbi:MAG TPA: oligosaccharide flippase family protein [Candidatus Acidoferrales bacterium]
MSASLLQVDEVKSRKETSPQISRGFATNLATVFIGQAACAALALGIEITYARFLGPLGRGQISLCMMVIAAGTLLAGLGGEIPIVIWTAAGREKVSNWLPAVVFWALLGCVLTGILWRFLFWQTRPAFLNGITPAMASLVFAAVPLSVAFTYLMAFLTGMESFQLRAWCALLTQSAELAALLALVLLVQRSAVMGIWALVLGLAAATIFCLIALQKTMRRPQALRFSGNALGASLSLGLRGQLGNLATFFNYRLDVFIVNYFLSPAQVGLYSLGVILSESLWQIPHAAAVALLPRTARTVEGGANDFTCTVIRQVVLLGCISGFALAIISPILIPLLFGRQFAPSIAIVWWILPGTIVFAVAKVMSADLSARGKPEYSSAFAIVSMVATVVLDLKFIPVMGIRGAALASSIAYTLDGILIAFALRRELRVSWKTLLIPTGTDLAVYRNISTRFLIWLRPSMAGN